MRDRMERLVVLPFTVGCVSSSSVSVSIHHRRRPKEHINSARTVRRSMEDVKLDPKGIISSDHQMTKRLSKSSLLSRPNIYIGVHRLTKTIKNLSQSLAYKEEMEELEIEMEIGFPTDVKHVTHIGINDGPPTLGTKGIINHLAASELLSLCRDDSMAPHKLPCATVVPKDAIDHGTRNTSCKAPGFKEK